MAEYIQVNNGESTRQYHFLITLRFIALDKVYVEQIDHIENLSPEGLVSIDDVRVLVLLY